MKQFLYYKSDKRSAMSGLTDRRHSLMFLLAEAKLLNRIAVLPQFIICGWKFHEGLTKKLDLGINVPEPSQEGSRLSYLIGDYFEVDRLGVPQKDNFVATRPHKKNI